MNDAVRNGSFIAKLSIVPKNFDKNQFDVEEAWAEYRNRPRYTFTLAINSAQKGYYYCIRVGKQNKLNVFRKLLLMFKSEKEITPLVRSMIDNNLYFSKRVTFASKNLALLIIDKFDPQNFKGAEVFIDYIGTALQGDGSNYGSAEIFNKNWYSHKIVENRGLNPFFVPFDYSCANGVPDPQQRLTFPVLLSMKFDFVDNNICMRHPAFIFLRDPETQKLSMKDQQKTLSKMEEWGMNVAIGGSITQDGELFSGSLTVIDQQGTLFEKSIDKMGYFELMGEMVAAWMEKSGSPVSPSLMTELLKPMTNNNASLSLLGQALMYKERSDEQMGLYEKILEQDPNFAELRWWYANQKWWQTKDDEWESSMYIKALESHLVVPALREISYYYNTPLADRYETVFENAKKIVTIQRNL